MVVLLSVNLERNHEAEWLFWTQAIHKCRHQQHLIAFFWLKWLLAALWFRNTIQCCFDFEIFKGKGGDFVLNCE